ncbi:hypothetical protein CDL60_01420 [Roseateles noduli]|nr:hypothetical protein CDL60_01420 [Roseateles noduli]
MKVFVSWSGERSKSMAAALRDWLPLVLHYVDPFVSESNIDAGARWSDVIARGLGESNFGILCITSENFASPWVLFEAGALAKSLEESRVVPLLLDIEFSGIAGPLAQFQAKKSEKAHLLEIVESINNSAPNPVQALRYKQLFEMAWPDLERKFSAIPKAEKPAKQPRSQAEVLEELVGAIRTMETRSREFPLEYRSEKRKKWYPMHMLEYSLSIGDDPRATGMKFLMTLSLLRDSAPWLYDLGMETYRVLISSPSSRSRVVVEQFKMALEFFIESPFAHEEFGPDSRRVVKILREIVDRFLESIPQRRRVALDELE